MTSFEEDSNISDTIFDEEEDTGQGNQYVEEINLARQTGDGRLHRLAESRPLAAAAISRIASFDNSVQQVEPTLSQMIAPVVRERVRERVQEVIQTVQGRVRECPRDTIRQKTICPQRRHDVPREDFLTMMFGYRIILKMYHFQTDFMSHHKAVDDYIVIWDEKIDRFLEVYQGIEGRLDATRIALDIDLTVGISPYLDLMIARLALEASDVGGELSDILLDMISDIYRLKYLLSFK